MRQEATTGSLLQIINRHSYCISAYSHIILPCNYGNLTAKQFNTMPSISVTFFGRPHTLSWSLMQRISICEPKLSYGQGLCFTFFTRREVHLLLQHRHGHQGQWVKMLHLGPLLWGHCSSIFSLTDSLSSPSLHLLNTTFQKRIH